MRKVELHCHLDGLINHEILKKLPGSEKYAESIRRLEHICPVRSYKDWMENYFPVTQPLAKNNGEFLLELLKVHFNELKAQNVVYTEIMLTFFNQQFDETDKQMELYKKYRQAADKAEDGKMQIEYIIAVGRTRDRRKMEIMLERILKAKELGLVVGAALAGVEEEDTIRPHTDIFRELKKAGVHIEIHAGEWGGAQSVREALEYGYPDRIGHGLAIFRDRELLDYIKEENIHIEFCPTSNLILTDIKSIEEHPIKTALEENMNFSISTDDPGTFCCSISHEYELVKNIFHLSDEDMERINRNSLAAAFAGKLKYIQSSS